MAFISLPKAYFLSKPDCKSTLNFPSGSSPDFSSPDYEKKVIDILETMEQHEFRYFFKSFVQEGKTTYMIVNFRNHKQCFDARMRVDNWDKLAGMKRTNGLSYPEELYEVKWQIGDREGTKELVYLDMHSIID
ncbi:hypothetical protein GXP67_32225 [Rhodocytophaga rosea]|uniref:Uncharacterized protein n=1 Tax=Rhodocytophaga rosea TaxID=2704465 RepID=A0A6C0GSA5_9BACT|nr:hypothetical protein [Rhodocytophaga rosea]QHT70985.1 hypothetical protein GXP67_32225 [Rhodocytophaga rosea]